jgi:hypothetical protein
MRASSSAIWSIARYRSISAIYPFFGGGGTFFPSLRASDNPIAIACFGFVTVFPLRPLFSLPCFIAFISRSTSLLADGLYLREELAFFALLFFADFFAAFLVAIVILPASRKPQPTDELHQQQDQP